MRPEKETPLRYAYDLFFGTAVPCLFWICFVLAASVFVGNIFAAIVVGP